jgi:hypothetical protein
MIEEEWDELEPARYLTPEEMLAVYLAVTLRRDDDEAPTRH